jgi:hypothetical protein
MKYVTVYYYTAEGDVASQMRDKYFGGCRRNHEVMSVKFRGKKKFLEFSKGG